MTQLFEYQHFHALERQDLAHRITLVEEHDFLDPGRFQEALPRLKQLRNPVLWACTNPLDIDAVVSRAEQVWAPGEFFVMHWDAASLPQFNSTPWPCFLINQRLNQRQPTEPRQHRIGMLSGRVRRHRIDFWCGIRDLVRDDDVVVINQFGLNQCGVDHPALIDLPWSNCQDYIDEDQSRSACTNTVSIQHPAFRACVNITAETLGYKSGVFITEKTWKAMAAGCMTWHFGCRDAAEYLASLGFRDWFGQAGKHQPSSRELFARNDIYDFYHTNLFDIERDLEFFWSQDLLRSITNDALARLESWLDR